MINEEEDDPLDQEIDFTNLKADREQTDRRREQAREAIERGEKPAVVITGEIRPGILDATNIGAKEDP